MPPRWHPSGGSLGSSGRPSPQLWGTSLRWAVLQSWVCVKQQVNFQPPVAQPPQPGERWAQASRSSPDPPACVFPLPPTAPLQAGRPWQGPSARENFVGKRANSQACVPAPPVSRHFCSLFPRAGHTHLHLQACLLRSSSAKLGGASALLTCWAQGPPVQDRPAVRGSGQQAGSPDPTHQVSQHL